MSDPIAFDTEPVTGAPYSAEAVTDVVQTLSDGNRIVRQNKAQISRDGHGRTRREQGFAMFGPLVNGPRGQRTAQRADFRSDHRQHDDARPAEPDGSQDARAATHDAAEQDRRRQRQCRRQCQTRSTSRSSRWRCPPPPTPRRRGGVMFNRVEAIVGECRRRSLLSNRSALSSWKASPSKAHGRR